MGMQVGNKGMKQGGRRRSGRKKELMREIKVKNLVDVMIVIIIILMV